MVFFAAADDGFFCCCRRCFLLPPTIDALLLPPTLFLRAAARPRTLKQPAAHVLQAASRFEGVLQHALSGPVSKSPICAPRLWRKIEGGTSKLGSDGDSAIFAYLVLQRPLKCVP